MCGPRLELVLWLGMLGAGCVLSASPYLQKSLQQ